jgi:hypothetical protein
VRIIFASLLATAAFAQTDRGNVTGQVTDSSGAAVAAVAISLINQATNVTVAINATQSGEFTAPNLPAGTYRLEAVLTGFKRYVQDQIIVTPGGTVRIDVQLEIGSVSESVEVQASALAVQTENAKIQTSVSPKMKDELPLVVAGAMRSVFNLVVIAPETRGENNQLSIGGGQAAAWNATLDGMGITTNRSANAEEIAYLTPSLDAITEFTIDSNGFKAEYGQAGGGVMSFVSKSGTNEFHGSVYNFFRNEAMDARGFFAATRSVLRQNNFGATGGGPVVIPKVYDGRNKTFFFAAYEGFRNRAGSNDTILSVPTPEMYDGNFSNWVDQQNRLLVIYDPATTTTAAGGGFTRQPFAGNRIPQNRFSRVAQQMMAIARPIAVPNRPGLVPGTTEFVRLNYQVQGGQIENPQDKFSLRGDHLFNERHRVSAFFNITEFNQRLSASGAPGLPAPLWNGQVQLFPTRTFRSSWDWTISPNKLNLLSIGLNSFDKTSGSPNVGGNWRDRICLGNVPDCNRNMMNARFTEFQDWGGTATNGTFQPSWEIREDFSWVKGKHTIKLGYSFQHQAAEGFGEQDIAGRADFSFLGTSVPGVTTFTSGSSFASFLLGEANLGRTETERFVPQVYPYHGFYAQTDWRVSRTFTLNLGLRYDLTLAPRHRTDEFSDFNPTRPNPAAGGIPGALWFAGFGEGRENTRSLVPNWYGGWGPRISFAWSPDSKTTIRSGYGRSFSRVTVVAGSGHFAGFIGQYVFNSLNQGVTPAFRLDDGLPAYPLPPQINPSFSNGNNVDFWQGQEATRAPEQNSWTFSIQREISRNTVMEAIYNGVRGSHLQTSLIVLNQVPTPILNDLYNRFGETGALNLLRANINSAAAQNAGIQRPFPTFTGSVNQALRPFPQYLNIVTGTQNGDKSGNSSYHSMVLRVERRLSAGLTGQWNYTFSKMITDSDTFFANVPNGAQDHYNRRLERSIGAFDQTHMGKFSTIYDLPWGKGRKWLQSGWASWVMGGWRVAAIMVYASGRPIALQRNNPLPIFNGPTRPWVDSHTDWRAPIQGDRFDPGADRFMVRSNFPTQPNTFGNMTRFNPKVRAFPSFNEDISVGKSFPLSGEGRRVDFRAEAFNIFNRTIFGTGNTNLNNAAFGVVANQANTPRQMQLALKIYW